MFHNCTRDLRQSTNQTFILESRRQCLLYFKFVNMFLSQSFLDQIENSRIINIIILYSSTITFDAQSKAKTKSFAKLVSRCQKSFEESITSLWKSFEKYIIFALIWNSFEHEIFASIVRSFSKNLWLHFAFCSW